MKNLASHRVPVAPDPEGYNVTLEPIFHRRDKLKGLIIGLIADDLKRGCFVEGGKVNLHLLLDQSINLISDQLTGICHELKG